MSLIWRIYYGDGSTFDNTMGEPHEAPSYNVQCVATLVAGYENQDKLDDIGFILLHNWQYYIYRDDIGWHGCFTDFDLLDHFISFGRQIIAVKKARTIPHLDYKRIHARACHDPDFPRKSAWRDEFEAPNQNGLFNASVIYASEDEVANLLR